MFSSVVEEHIKKYLYLYAVLFSVLSSIYFISTRITISTDDVVYLVASQTFLDEGLVASSRVSSNVLFPILIGLVSKVSNLSLVSAAGIVNTAMLSTLLLSYLYLIRLLGGNKTIQLIAAILILLNPNLNGYRESFFRDPGYWAFSILSLGLLLRFQKRNDLLSIVLWIVSVGLAGLFRPEAGIFLFAPLGLLFNSKKVLKLRLSECLKIYGVLAICSALVVGAMFSMGLASLYEGIIDHIVRYQGASAGGYPSFVEMSLRFSKLFTYRYPDEFIWLGWGLALTPYFLSSLSGAITWSVLLAFAYCYYKKVLIFPLNGLYRSYVFLSLSIMIIFLLMASFLITRYAVLTGLLLMSALPFSLYKAYAGKWQLSKVKGMTAIFLLVLFIDSFISFGHSTKYVPDGISWVNENTPVDSRVMSNERKITYSINRQKTYDDSELAFVYWPERDISQMLKSYDYFVEDVFWDKDAKLLNMVPDAQEVIRFSSERGNRLIIYKLP